MTFQKNLSFTNNFTGMRPLLIPSIGHTGICQFGIFIYFLSTVKENEPDLDYHPSDFCSSAMIRSGFETTTPS
jgi:hypothetical protein